MPDFVKDFMQFTGIPAFAVLVGLGVWSFFTLIVSAYHLFTGKDN